MTQRLGEKPRIAYLDLLRILACFLVTVNHTVGRVYHPIAPSGTWFLGITYFFVSKIAVPIFVMITGVVLLGRQDSYRKHAERLARMVCVLVLFALLYYVNAVAEGKRPLQGKEFLRTLYRGDVTVSFWYLYMYIGLLAIMPLLQRLNAAMKKQDYIYYFALSLGLVGVLPVLLHYFPSLGQNSKNVYLAIFNGYICMLFLGYYIENYLKITRKVAISALAVFVLSIAVEVILTYFEYGQAAGKRSYLFLDRVTLTTILVPSACAFICVKYAARSLECHPRLSRGVKSIGGCTFGVYLISDYIVGKSKTMFAALSTSIHPLLALLIQEVSVFAVCLLAAWVLKKLPVFRKLL